ncbi:uncharacterized protein C7orf50 isoform X1 [Puntigrus tetrazona]|uniref:uncharacterized protein C7orf50 isoform X1 n=1 Tax=Puntigrus tetrazona TaxID=1606681 RepID=UPI001C89A93C|nr:uncharacterized protein C7orf50 isoform X1 [Puntigrus tetrazona]XP_043081957.1 uncharacterized protein C7orf50 isoform X1 [Puntigrus tetrazona]XP_043081958.1 uncharacterized protein C7orf50 isoform X1 [Puntigrus tetrazona]
MTYVQDETKKPKKSKKRKANDEESREAVPESDLVTSQNDETERKKKKKKKKSKAEESREAVPESDLVTSQNDETERKKKKKKKSKAESTGDTETSQQREPSLAEDENGSDGEEELSPEEKRVLERKLKKILKKEEKKRLKEEGTYVKKAKVKPNLAEKKALEYLMRWSERREEWKFQKSRQIWLLQHMYDSTKVTDDHFEVLLAYLEGLCGASRDITLQKAEAIVRWEGQGEEEDKEEAEKKKQRAKQVVQLL